MSYEFIGTITKIEPTEKISDTFSIRKFRVQSQGQYPQLILFQCTQDRISLLDRNGLGEQIKVYFDLAGKETKDGRLFNANLNVWRIESVNGIQQPLNPPTTQPGNDDRLPF